MPVIFPAVMITDFASLPPAARSSAPAGDRDVCVQAAAIQAFRNSGHPALRRLDCQVCGRSAVLHGSVPTFYLKQLAQVLVMQLDEHLIVRNLLRVAPSPR